MHLNLVVKPNVEIAHFGITLLWLLNFAPKNLAMKPDVSNCNFEISLFLWNCAYKILAMKLDIEIAILLLPVLLWNCAGKNLAMVILS